MLRTSVSAPAHDRPQQADAVLYRVSAHGKRLESSFPPFTRCGFCALLAFIKPRVHDILYDDGAGQFLRPFLAFLARLLSSRGYAPGRE
jgi:hypothetical protein